ncbi:MAG TPA: PD-(D/E)XK nuclease family protein, partial [Phycisphaerae bacterium]|nr:PD-(D/E)XK nuclease family protein [Phycisphaerae bacterium]
MTQRADNSFIASLGEQCRRNMPDEKILVAPTRRIGRQWLQRVCMSGVPIVNVRIETLSSLAMNFAADELSADGRRLLPDNIGPLPVDSLLRENESDWPDSPGLADALYNTIRDLRNSCVDAADLEKAGFETSQRGARLVKILNVYADKIHANGYFDTAELYLKAAANAPSNWPAESTAICSAAEQTFWTAAQWTFWRSIPQDKKIVSGGSLPLQPAEARANEQNVSLRNRFDVALKGKSDKVKFFRSLGQAAEIREIFRRCITQKIPLDEVEILYTDRTTYLPLLCEECSAVFGSFDTATFIQGIPAMYSRPGRLVMEWCEWVSSKFSQKSFERMLCDGLFVTGHPSGVLAEKLAALPVGFGRQRWLDVIGGEAELHPDDAVLAELRDIAKRHATLAASLDCDLIKPEILLHAATELVTKHSRCADAFDNLARQRLAAFLSEFTVWYDSHPARRDVSTADRLEWLKSAVKETAVGALGPMSGRIHVSPLHGGGKSGRKHVFIVGMNDAFFPGKGRQDPLLLDDERQNIFEFTHKLLPLSWHMQHESIERLLDFIGEFCGKITLSYCCHDMIDDSEMYPATILLTLAAVLQNAASFSLEELNNLAGQPVAFLPGENTQAVDAARGILAHYGNDPAKMELLCRRTYPNLQDGYAAAAAWNSVMDFTEYDGNVQPASDDSQPLFSPSGLETLAICPRKFMFVYRLKIQPPDEISPDAETWLNAADFGTLMHDSFCEFYRRRAAAGNFNVTNENTRDELVNIIDTNMKELERRVPVPGENARRTTRRQAFQAMDIFLREEAIYFRECGYRPLYMEAAIGLPPEKIGSTCGTELDRKEPLKISAGNGLFRIRGRIDRIDRDTTRNSYTIWDYKTGSSKKFR